jgi:hypothetical protein
MYSCFSNLFWANIEILKTIECSTVFNNNHSNCWRLCKSCSNIYCIQTHKSPLKLPSTAIELLACLLRTREASGSGDTWPSKGLSCFRFSVIVLRKFWDTSVEYHQHRHHHWLVSPVGALAFLFGFRVKSFFWDSLWILRQGFLP